MTVTQLREWADAGMEVGAHTRTHPHLPKISAAQMEQEVRGSKARHAHRKYKSNPMRKDTDRDGLKDKVELTGRANARHGHVASNPLNWDTDHGGISDRGEVRSGSNPASAVSGPRNPRLPAPLV